jgi:plasmid segregation protein ParM
MYIFALDIGYSNLKVAYGTPDKMKTVVRPATAGPKERMPFRTAGAGGGADPIYVQVGDATWAACVEPGRLQGTNREIHEDYTRSDTYKALFYAALSFAETDTIDMLVTGLPVRQAKDEAMVERVGKQFVGTHTISAKRKIKVKNVKVVAQPSGAFMDLVYSTDLMEVVQEGRVVVVDPGFFSVDYIAVERGELRQHISGTSLKAMLEMLEKTNELIALDYGCGPGTDRLEHAVQNGKSTVLVSGTPVAIDAYLKAAQASVAKEALVEMRKDMRSEANGNVDLLLLAGGGSHFYMDAAREIYPDCRNVVVSKAPHLANVRGYFMLGAV